jgi:hypothetical protein
LLDLAPV